MLTALTRIVWGSTSNSERKGEKGNNWYSIILKEIVQLVDEGQGEVQWETMGADRFVGQEVERV